MFYLASSSFAELIASTFLCPFEALRIQSVSHGKQRFQEEYRLKKLKLDPLSSNIAEKVAVIPAKNTLGSLFQGLFPILLKQIPYTMTQLTVFSLLVDAIYSPTALSKFPGRPWYALNKEELSTQAQLGVTVGCGCIAGVASAVASHPSDTILTKINIDRIEGEGSMKASFRIANKLGMRGVWTGLPTRCGMVGLLSSGMFLVYDSVKVAVGLPTSGK